MLNSLCNLFNKQSLLIKLDRIAISAVLDT